MNIDLIKKNLRYDPKSGLIFWKNNGSGRSIHKPAGNFSKKTMRCIIHIDRKCYLRSRLAFVLMNKPVPHTVDHINGCSYDDRWINLRPSDPSKNSWNKKICKQKGTLRHGNLWRAMISKNKKRYYKSFLTRQEASDWYLKMKKKLHGKYCRK